MYPHLSGLAGLQGGGDSTHWNLEPWGPGLAGEALDSLHLLFCLKWSRHGDLLAWVA